MKAQKEVMRGNDAIARGLVEAGLELAAACPGTPGSDLLPGIIGFGREEKKKVYAEWSTNERCAFEVAFGAALHGTRAVCAMGPAGLDTAFPAILKGKGKPLKGALVIIVVNDPGQQTWQTEQDTRLLATLFAIPVFDSASPKEAGDLAYRALSYSFEHKTPVILRSTRRVSSAREEAPLYSPGPSAGCPRRASFLAMKEAFPEAVYPGDTGCHPLGASMGAFDTCLDTGGAVNIAAGFHDAFRQDGVLMPVAVSVGDSTFFHACLSSLYDAVLKKKRFILVIMDNSTTAPTGMEPAPRTGVRADGTTGRPILIEDIIAGFGIKFLRITDSNDVPLMVRTLKEAYAFLEDEGDSPAVIIDRGECLLLSRKRNGSIFDPAALQDECMGCGLWADAFHDPVPESPGRNKQ